MVWFGRGLVQVELSSVVHNADYWGLRDPTAFKSDPGPTEHYDINQFIYICDYVSHLLLHMLLRLLLVRNTSCAMIVDCLLTRTCFSVEVEKKWY
jgi:hypothetical protein